MAFPRKSQPRTKVLSGPRVTSWNQAGPAAQSRTARRLAAKYAAKQQASKRQTTAPPASVVDGQQRLASLRRDLFA